MVYKTCPKCKVTLYNFNHYYCSNCGTKLPPEYVNPIVPVKIMVYDYKSREKEGVLRFKKVVDHVFDKDNYKTYAASVCMFILGVLIGNISTVAYQKKSTTSTLELAKVEKVATKQVVPVNADFSLARFDDTFLAYVPAGADAYIQLNDFKLFGDIERTLDLGSLLTPPFAVFDYKHNWVFLFKVKDKNAVKDKTFPGWNAGIVEDVLVVTKDAKMFDIVKNAKNSFALSLELSPEYALAKNLLKDTGIAKGFIFLLTEDGKKDFGDLKNTGFDEIIKSVLDLGYKETILK